MTGDSDAPERELSDMCWRKTKNSKDATAGDIGSTISQYCFHIVHCFIFILHLCVSKQHTDSGGFVFLIYLAQDTT